MEHIFKEGDRVQVVDREANADDVKSSMFYNHYRGLIGTVQKVFETTDDIAVTIDETRLPEPIGTRHNDVRLAMRAKWLDGLSEEARSKLTDQEKDFKLRYTILVAPKDLLPSNEPVPDEVKAIEVAPSMPSTVTDLASPRRKTAAEIEAAEEEYLRSRKTEG